MSPKKAWCNIHKLVFWGYFSSSSPSHRQAIGHRTGDGFLFGEVLDTFHWHCVSLIFPPVDARCWPKVPWFNGFDQSQSPTRGLNSLWVWWPFLQSGILERARPTACESLPASPACQLASPASLSLFSFSVLNFTVSVWEKGTLFKVSTINFITSQSFFSLTEIRTRPPNTPQNKENK